MKKSIVLTIVLFFTLMLTVDAKHNSHKVEFDYFYDTLAPHGEWIELEYDNYVWRPDRVGRNWSPYSDGRWVWSSDGWYWDSYEAFGWATYHYGRWYYDRSYGWVWSPGNEWAPAWVEWRYDDDYIGWAPLPPYSYFNVNIGIQFSVEWNSPHSHWRFVKYNKFTHRHVGNYYVGNPYVRRFFGRTKYVTNYHYEGRRIVNRGIKRSIIEKRGRIKIHESRMDNIRDIQNRKVRRDDRTSVKVFRPSEVERMRSKSNKRYDFGKRSNNYLMREKSVRKKDGFKNRMSLKKNEETRYNKKKDSKRNSSVSKLKSTQKKENTNRLSYERTNRVQRQKVNSSRNVLQKNNRSNSKKKNSLSRNIAKEKSKTDVDVKASRKKRDSNRKSTVRRRVDKQEKL